MSNNHDREITPISVGDTPSTNLSMEIPPQAPPATPEPKEQQAMSKDSPKKISKIPQPVKKVIHEQVKRGNMQKSMEIPPEKPPKKK